MPRITLITGGARSGKSRYALTRTSMFAAPWTYLATAEARDEEMTKRIRTHQDERAKLVEEGPAVGWVTVEEPLELVDGLRENERGGARLVDCLTLWISNLMEADRDIDRESDRLKDYLLRCSVPVILVTNEVGMGIVPANPVARRFRDEAGRLNQIVASVADEVIFMVSGIPMRMTAAEIPKESS